MARTASRTRLLSIGVIAAIGALSTAWTFAHPTTFRAVAVARAADGRDVGKMTLQDLATIMTRDEVIGNAARAAEVWDAGEYRVSAEPDAGRMTVTVTATGPDPDAARRLAEAVVEYTPAAAGAGSVSLERGQTRVRLESPF